MQDFTNAASYYEQLTNLFPDVTEYKLYHAQSLYQAFMYDEAFKVTTQIDNPELGGQVKIKLQGLFKKSSQWTQRLGSLIFDE